MEKKNWVFPMFPCFFPLSVCQNHSQRLRGPQLIILTKYGPPPTSPDPFHTHFTFFNFRKNIKNIKTQNDIVFRFFEGIRPRDHAHSIEHQDAGAIRLNESSVRPNATSLVTKQNSERKSEREQSHNPYPWVEKCKQFTLSTFYPYFEWFSMIFE